LEITKKENGNPLARKGNGYTVPFLSLGVVGS